MLAVITSVSGRHDHLVKQRQGLRRNTGRVDLHVVAAVADPDLGTLLGRCVEGPSVALVDVPNSPSSGSGLPLARARNAGAELAIAAGADQLIFLDVDCIPGPDLVNRYAACLGQEPLSLLSGPVSYLPPPPPQGYDLAQMTSSREGHPGRPVPPEDAVVHDADHRLFWSLSFALDRRTWQAIGGFCELYEGYGGEDTDFGQLAAAAGIRHSWVGGAWAYHQYHHTQNPPIQHVASIIRNARIFQERWGWWPMHGWLQAFAEMGLVTYDARQGSWLETERPREDVP